MKIGIYSGHFDPPHLGHAWIIDQMVPMFDEVHVVLGPNPGKEPEFTEETRLELLYRIASWEWKDKVKFLKLEAPNLIEYARGVVAQLYNAQDKKANFWTNRPSVFIVRGIRNDIDWRYEQEIYRCMSKKNGSGSIKFMYLMSPSDRKDISSSNVKKACRMKLWDLVLDWCGRELIQFLLEFYEGKDWTKYKDLVSIFETTTAGFSPVGDLKRDKQREILMNSSSGHQMEMADEKSGRDWLVCHPPVADIQDPPIGLGFLGFPGDNGTSLQQQASGDADLLEAGKLINWAEVITKEQVVGLLDTFPYNVAVSEKYYLREISVDSKVGTIGKRHLAQSRSLGPIVIDKNELPGTYYQGFGKVIVIEGKHRWLDAKARGDKTILAWVGEKALEHLNVGSDLQVLGTGLADLPSGGGSPLVPEQQA